MATKQNNVEAHTHIHIHIYVQMRQTDDKNEKEHVWIRWFPRHVAFSAFLPPFLPFYLSTNNYQTFNTWCSRLHFCSIHLTVIRNISLRERESEKEWNLKLFKGANCRVNCIVRHNTLLKYIRFVGLLMRTKRYGNNARVFLLWHDSVKLEKAAKFLPRLLPIYNSFKLLPISQKFMTIRQSFFVKYQGIKSSHQF